MTDQDPHAPTTAGPEPAADAVPPAPEPAPDPGPEPTPVVGAADATWDRPAGSAQPAGAPVDPHPEKLVGAAFGGGIVFALVLKGLAKRRHA